MSFWGATVITNLITAIPYVGVDIVEWIWGGFSVSNATLNRFFSFHYLFPFVLAALVIIHLLVLHTTGSNNPLGINSSVDTIPFHPYYSSKDLFGFAVFGIFFSFFIFFAPNMLGHSDNYIPANPLVTPTHIVPEWYFLFAYAILRSIPDKLFGVLALAASLFVLFTLPYTHTSNIRSFQFRPLSKVVFWYLVVDFFLLTYIGQCPVEEPWYTVGQVCTVVYFGIFLIVLPLVGYLENRLFRVNPSLKN